MGPSGAPSERRRRAVLLAPAAALLLLQLPAGAHGGEVGLQTSARYDRGDYGDRESLTTWSLITEIFYRSDRWQLALSVPVHRQEAVAPLHSGPIRVPGPGAGGAGSRGGGGSGGSGRGGGGGGGNGGNGGGSGGGGHGGGNGGGGGSGGSDGGGAALAGGQQDTRLGDPVLRLDVQLPGTAPGGIRLGVFAAAKLPADGDGSFSTGEWDFGAGLVARRASFHTITFLEVGTWRLGDAPGLELDDPLTYSLAVERPLTSGAGALTAFARGHTATLPGGEDALEVGGAYRHRLTASHSLGLTATTGLADGSPDLSLALTWRWGSVARWRPTSP